MRTGKTDIRRTNGVKADLLLLPGDILEGDRQNDRTGEFAGRFRKIATTYGLFACPGNHEFHGRDDTLVLFRKSGITMLRDVVVKIDDAFWLVGRIGNYGDQDKVRANKAGEGCTAATLVRVPDSDI